MCIRDRYQTLYLYVEGHFDKLSVPFDHIYNQTLETEPGEVIVLEGTSEENVIIPCRPAHPDITIELYRQDPRLDEPIVDSISNINSKVFSSKFYQHHITPLFYFHPRIGFVLDNFGGQTSHLAWFLSFLCLGFGSLFSTLTFKYYLSKFK